MNKLNRKLLNFDVKKRALLITGGDQPSTELIRQAKEVCSYFVCADRGAKAYIEAGLLPDLIVGDMDSIDETTRQAIASVGRQKVLPVEKDDTDTQAALDILFAEGFEEVLMLGALGGRMDHELGNIMLLVGYGRREKNIIIWNEENAMRYVSRGNWQIEHSKDYFSIVPMSDNGITISLEGFYYFLEKTKVATGISRTLSNYIVDEQGTMVIETGDGIIFMSCD